MGDERTWLVATRLTFTVTFNPDTMPPPHWHSISAAVNSRRGHQTPKAFRNWTGRSGFPGVLEATFWTLVVSDSDVDGMRHFLLLALNSPRPKCSATRLRIKSAAVAGNLGFRQPAGQEFADLCRLFETPQLGRLTSIGENQISTIGSDLHVPHGWIRFV